MALARFLAVASSPKALSNSFLVGDGVQRLYVLGLIAAHGPGAEEAPDVEGAGLLLQGVGAPVPEQGT